MGKTLPSTDMQGPPEGDLEQFFRGKVPGDAGRWATAWAMVELDAEEARDYDADDPAEWAADVEAITGKLRAGMQAGRVVKPSGGNRTMGDGVGSDQLAAHQTARSVTLAEHAGQHPDVKAFRATWLPAGVRTTDDEVRGWVGEHAGPVEVSWTTEEGKPETAALAEGVGRELAGIVRRLSSAYRWEPQLAAAFVLTGAVPHAPMLRVKSNPTTGKPTGNASDLITLRVHPDVPAGEVEAAYRAVQAEHWGTRAHLISDRVAEAVLRSVTVPGGPAAQNAAMGKGYKDAGQFRRTVDRAKARLMGNPRKPGPLTLGDFEVLLGRPR